MAKNRLNLNDPALMKSLISTMIAKTPVAYIILDRELRIHFINDYFLEFRKLDKKRVLGGHCYDVSNRGVPCRFCAVREAIQKGSSHMLTRRDVLPDGSVRYMDDYAVPLMKPDGTFDYVLEMMINRTAELTVREETGGFFLKTVETLINILEKKDIYTATHSRDVSAISSKLAAWMGLSEDEVFMVALSALVHDLGKMQIPDGIINKAGKLDDGEFATIQSHPGASFELLGDLKRFHEIREAARSHHERWDGRGYPQKLAGADIPLSGRIIAIADTYDAMTSNRSYRQGLGHDVAVAEVEKNAGRQFDPDLAAKFVAMAHSHYNTREKMISKPLRNAPPPTEAGLHVERRIRPSADYQNIDVDKEGMASLMSDEVLATEVLKNTPAYYVIVDDAFHIIYASEAMSRDLGISAEDLLKMRCFEVNDKNMSCFGVENGQLKCPIVRAFKTGTEQTGKVTEKFKGQTMHFDIFAVPMELVDEDGNPFKCAMEILVDRTEEVNSQMEKQSGLKDLLQLLYRVVLQVDVSTTGNYTEMFQEWAAFGEYLAGIALEHRDDDERDAALRIRAAN